MTKKAQIGLFVKEEDKAKAMSFLLVVSVLSLSLLVAGIMASLVLKPVDAGQVVAVMILAAVLACLVYLSGVLIVLATIARKVGK